MLTAVVVGAGFSGDRAPASRSRRAGITDFVILEKADRVGGTWRDNTYPGAACDVPVAPLLVLVRAEPALVAHVRRPGGDPRVPRALRRPSTASARTSGSAQAVDGARSTRRPGSWHVRTHGRRDARGARAAARQRRAAHPVAPRHPGARRRSQGKHVPLGALEPRLRPRRQARRRDRHRRERDPVRAADRAAGRAAAPVPAHAAVDRAQARSRRSPRASSGRSRTCPARTGSAARGCTGCSRAACSASRTRRRSHELAEQLVRAPPRRKQVPDPVLRAKLTPTYRLGCKRVLISNDYYPALQRDERRGRHRRDRRDHAARRAHRRRPRARGRRDHLRHRLQGHRVPVVDPRCVGTRRPSISTTPGAVGCATTSASRSRASRTCSC